RCAMVSDMFELLSRSRDHPRSTGPGQTAQSRNHHEGADAVAARAAKRTLHGLIEGGLGPANGLAFECGVVTAPTSAQSSLKGRGEWNV
ncbi:MAG: hypothetical protein WBO17_08460, partial [Sphingorhabdus sp.]